MHSLLSPFAKSLDQSRGRGTAQKQGRLRGWNRISLILALALSSGGAGVLGSSGGTGSFGILGSQDAFAFSSASPRARSDRLTESFAAPKKPKYVSTTRTLSADHGFFRQNAAPDFWSLIPYYVPQQNDMSCSVASAVAVLNAIRSNQSLSGLTAVTALTSDDELITHANLLARPELEGWNKAVHTGGHGVALEQLKGFLETSLRIHGIKGAEVTAIHMTDRSPRSAEILHAALLENERSARDFMIANFIQGVYTGDAEVGHIAPVGAYDEKKKRVLILDPDRRWYEPYWVSEEVFLAGMATNDKESGMARGFIRIRLKK